jgi:hypothetical protein
MTGPSKVTLVLYRGRVSSGAPLVFAGGVMIHREFSIQDSTKTSLNFEAWGEQFNNNVIEPRD